jgi:hypothetical protein
MPLESWIQHSRVNEFLYDWQTIFAGLAALIAALIAVGGSEWRARKALRSSLAGEIRLYVELLIDARDRLTEGKEAFRSGKQPHRDFDWAVLPPPVVYPAAAGGTMGLLRRPRAAAVVDFYANIGRANFTVRRLSNEPTENVSVGEYSVLIDLFEAACRTSLPLLSKFPFDKRDAEFKAEIAKWDAERAATAALRQKATEK